MKRVLILLAFLGTMLHAGAQVMVSGRVVDANDGLELMGLYCGGKGCHEPCGRGNDYGYER